MTKTIIPETLIDDSPRTLTFNCYRVYDMKRYTADPKTQSFIPQFHLQKMEDSHTLCGYKTDVRKTHGRWTLTSLGYFADIWDERDAICFRCLRIWSLKNGLTFPRQWMIDRINMEEKEARKVTMRGKNE